MRNYYLLLLLLGTLAVITNRNRQARVLSPDPTRISRPEIKPPAKIIALVKYDEVIYRCHNVELKACGYDIQCEDFHALCVENAVIEYIRPVEES